MKYKQMIMLILVLVSTSVFSQETILRKYKEIEIKLDDFYRVKFNQPFHIIYKQSKDSAGIVRIYAEEQVLKDLLMNTKKGILSISLPLLINYDFGMAVFTIYSSTLSEISNDGSGVFECKTPLLGSELNIKIGTDGQIKLTDIDYGIVKGQIYGRGDLLLEGKCRESELRVSGSGEIRTVGLETKNVKASIVGNGVIACWATNNLNTSITGSGTIYYKGSPAIIKPKTVGTGRLIEIKE